MTEPHNVSGGAAPQFRLFSRETIFGALGFLGFITLLTFIIDRVGIQQLQDAVASSGAVAPLFYVALKALTYVFAPLTSGPIQLSAGVLFGLWEGVLLTLIGEVIGGSISFWIARLAGRPMVRRLVGAAGMDRVDRFYAENLRGWQALAIARVLLFSFWDFLSYAAGLGPVRYRLYLWVSIVLGFIPTFVFVYFGTTLTLNSNALLLAYLLVGAMIVVPLLFRRQLMRLLRGGRASE